MKRVNLLLSRMVKLLGTVSLVWGAVAVQAEPAYQLKERVKPIEPTLTLLSTPEAREKYAVEFRRVGDKVLLYQGGKPLNTTEVPAIFVMDAQGKFYATTRYAPDVFNHLSFFAGEPVAAAGEMLVRNGELREMNNRSGHYVPGKEFHYQALYGLGERGVVPFRGLNSIPSGWRPGTCPFPDLAP